MGGAPESSVGATRRSLVPPFGLLKNLTRLVTRGGRRGGCGPGRRARGGPESSVGATRRPCFDVLGSPKNLTIGLIWLVTRGGGVGGVGQGGGQGGVDGGGHQRAVWEQQGVHSFHFLHSLKNLTIGLIWLVTREGGVGGVGQGGGQGGVDGGGTREQCGVTRGGGVGIREKAFTTSTFWVS